MKAPALQGVIERRLLLNYKVDPRVVTSHLPEPFRPQLVNGYAVAGICLLRLGELRPAGFPPLVGRRSENVAHRIAVEWDEGDVVRTGVYITRRESDSRLNVLVGGRIFPGVHHMATFGVAEAADEIAIEVRCNDGGSAVDVRARIIDELKESDLFEDLASASAFFEHGSLGFSPGRHGRDLEAMRLSTDSWQVEPLQMERVRSSFFDDVRAFPPGSANFDCGLVMRNIPVKWHQVRVGPLTHVAVQRL